MYQLQRNRYYIAKGQPPLPSQQVKDDGGEAESREEAAVSERASEREIERDKGGVYVYGRGGFHIGVDVCSGGGAAGRLRWLWCI
ncbi:hypothetical protein LIER_28506 [Lithospermum erythrorhizon]|uniref:Uncharacterized protein n=1 Tax=Lithospermum erythrorhizon TaxID=34254 RepID=A0AAV3RHI6_LITER